MLILREAIRWVSWVVRQIVFYNKLESGKDFIFIRILNLFIKAESVVLQRRICLYLFTSNSYY
ncbi:hypothetical protein [Leptospira noguchii]|uniref:hypothetical protein n=1 Tax=Leptospira noguchii TaxID=28182 RepID=UPI003BF7C0AF